MSVAARRSDEKRPTISSRPSPSSFPSASAAASTLAPSLVHPRALSTASSRSVPVSRPKERSPTAGAAWLATTYPAIAKRARAEGAAIYWGATTGIAQQDQIGRSDAPRGQMPVVARSARRITHGMSSAINNRGVMWFMLHAGVVNAARFIKFLHRLRRDAGRKVFWPGLREAPGRKVFLIVANQKVHHANKVKAWVAAHAHKIELFHLPP